ncbi:hypothetical protein TRIP_B200050 [uncultured Desulfatiglans sp.]|uniref:Uncharacterized protein n=1 Tax=Uncultured Desulfatiglans sp. TaxID=1748965 RepID=A0A653A1J4_UNCDX|nr:hypothetical protein TRIP_B200050 [uncultured Desulfatiglans sp.]
MIRVTPISPEGLTLEACLACCCGVPHRAGTCGIVSAANSSSGNHGRRRISEAACFPEASEEERGRKEVRAAAAGLVAAVSGRGAGCEETVGPVDGR